MIRNRWTLAGVLGLGLFPMHWDLFPLVIPAVHAQSTAAASPRTYSPTSSIRLPIQIDDKTRAALSELKLYVKAPGGDWVCGQTAPTSQTAFDYKAEKDGEYAFMFVLVAKDGRTSPANLDARPPHQIIVVDTVKPVLNVQPLPFANREIYLQCQMQDANPDPASVRLEYDAGDSQWKSMELVNPDTPAVFRIPFASVLEGKVRATARDKAGNVSQRVIDLGDPTRSHVSTPKPKEPAALPPDVVKVEPQVLPPLDARNPAAVQTDYKAPVKKVDPFEIKVPEPEVKAPAPSGYNPNRPKPIEQPKEPIDPVTIPDVNAPPIIDPRTTENTGIVPPPDVQQTAAKVDPARPVTPYRQEPVQVESPRQIIPHRAESMQNDMRPATPLQGTHPIINTTRCTLDYAVENIVIGGVPKMEFWATKDNGRTWVRVPDESGGRSPAKLLLPGDGMYGVRIKANGNGQPPHLGEAPDCWVEVDAIPPTVRLLPPLVGSGTDVGTMTIQWMAHDKNLISDSITIKYADRPDGPWMPIATNLRNEGSYRWLIPAGIGSEVYLRLEASDRAGNLGRSELRDPVAMPQPKVKVLGIGPAR